MGQALVLRMHIISFAQGLMRDVDVDQARVRAGFAHYLEAMASTQPDIGERLAFRGAAKPDAGDAGPERWMQRDQGISDTWGRASAQL
jgi:hypothetical protein